VILQCKMCERWLPVERFRRNNRRCKLCCLLVEYGALYKQYMVVLEFQNHSCAICKDPNRKLEMEHDPVSFRWRGLVCRPCNRGISWIEMTGVSVDIIDHYLRNSPTKILGIECFARAAIINKAEHARRSWSKIKERTRMFRELS
jgi:Recombination endonuclease VII.